MSIIRQLKYYDVLPALLPLLCRFMDIECEHGRNLPLIPTAVNIVMQLQVLCSTNLKKKRHRC